MNLSVKQIFSLTFLLSSSLIQADYIIIDSDFFIREVRSRTIWDVGPSNLIGFYNPIKIVENLFKAFETILPQDPSFPYVYKEELVMPQIIKNWVCDIQPPEQIRDHVLQELRKMDALGINTKLFQSLAAHILTPSRFAQARDCDHDAAKIIRAIHAARDHNGNPRHKIYYATNQSTATFNEFEKNPAIKSVIDLASGKFTSGESHVMKPDPAFYREAFKKFGIAMQPQQRIVYIDTEESFINKLKELGIPNIEYIHCKNYHYKSVAQKLKKLGIYK